ncbi:peptidase inhibitor family I36 protein [Streptomyces sp. NBC_01351]|uniref:hypothetical protein n=1 Tax=Streptomyces sp. NBC_01351 TaxID=2903833 RepID=UPI002E37D6E9|nr:hypothetical protein [Streptomyces sp. NBC_01351]
MKLRNSLRTVAAAGLVLGAVAVGTGSASAAEKDGWLTDGELGLFCWQDQSNSVLDLYVNDINFYNDYFKGTKSCNQQLTDNNTESWSNRDTYTWKVYTGSGGQGYQATLGAGTRGNFNSTFFNQISSAFYF